MAKKIYWILAFLCCWQISFSQEKLPSHMHYVDHQDVSAAKPWVFWYWMHAAFSKEGIKADLEAMKEMGIAGAYLAPIKGKIDPPLYEPVIETLTPQWWDFIRFTLHEADRLGIQLALLPNDGFATAGGPWITPALSMQKVVWADTLVSGGQLLQLKMPMPESYDGYYEDIATYAFPVSASALQAETPVVTTSTGEAAQFLVSPDNKKNFGSNQPCWIQYTYQKPVTCRAIHIDVNGFNYQSGRLIIQTSKDGKQFKTVTRLVPPRAGWLDWDTGVTHAMEPITAKYFRFVYDPKGSEPGGEDLDAAKWKPGLKISGIQLLNEAHIHQYEGKSGRVWRISTPTTVQQLADADCIPKEKLINLTAKVQKDGRLNWNAPVGYWRILRMGHTSTGHKNETAGRGKGLECDKLNPAAVQVQLAGWLQRAVEAAGPDLIGRVLKIFHVDSWECGSQNWSPVFRTEFKQRRGYDPVAYLPAIAGYPIESADFSERYLYDIRQTIAELINDNFFEPIRRFTHENNALFTAETTAPVMLTDGMAHFKYVDIPMGEFWLRSPSHDKFNDILDAVSGAHIYGKPIVQAEAFTQIRMQWDEHPGNVKALQDRNYALGINKLVYHVYVHNPWMNKKPGMTLDGIGLYFQRDQTWWKPGKAWVDYTTRTQQLLQQGNPVVDMAVFTGEELPRRALLPDRLVATLPGVFGADRVESERQRLENKDLAIQKIAGVSTSAHMVQPENWVNALHGYTYDSFNPEALLQAIVKDERICLPSGMEYKVLVLPLKHVMQPDNQAMSLAVIRKIQRLIRDGATVIVGDKPTHTLGWSTHLDANNKALVSLANQLWEGPFETVATKEKSIRLKTWGRGRIIQAPYSADTFDPIGITRDVIFTKPDGRLAINMGFNHRRSEKQDVYFLTNQQADERQLVASFRVSGRVPYFYDAVRDVAEPVKQWTMVDGRTNIPLRLAAHESRFILFKESTSQQQSKQGLNWPTFRVAQVLTRPWQVHFDKAYGGPETPVTFKQLHSWSEHPDTAIRYYSGTASYRTTFHYDKEKTAGKVWLQLDTLANMAVVKLNGMACGTIWTPPYRVDVSRALKNGDNHLEIAVTNTWANRLIGDKDLPENQRITHTTAPDRLGHQALLKAGLMGDVKLLKEEEMNDE